MHKYFVQTVEQITPTTLLITLQSDQSGAPFSFQPGQYAVINYKRKHRPSVARCFSIVSSPTDQGKLQFSMRTKGHYTRSLTKLKPGDEVDVRGPYGGFVLHTERLHERVVLLAGGIGITPFMSMIRYAASVKAETLIDLIYSNPSQDDVPFGEELKHKHLLNHNFKATFMIGDGPTDKFAGSHVGQGRITSDVVDDVMEGSNYAETVFYICGPPPFMKGMNSMLRSKGIQKSQIMTEAFSQGPHRQTGKIRNWPFNMYSMTATGFALGSFVVMMSDLTKTLPPSTIFGSTKSAVSKKLSSGRQKDLDQLVNELPDGSNGAPESDEVKAANQAAVAPQSTPQATQPTSKTKTSTVSTSSGKTSSTSPSPSPTPNPTPNPSPSPTPAPTPAPTPPPKCTTTQSGVTVC